MKNTNNRRDHTGHRCYDCEYKSCCIIQNAATIILSIAVILNSLALCIHFIFT